ncbi:prolyl oligopeptidase family serine peptidase [Streptomyces olivaceoviridis]|uniref:alpha/beta hydrolase family protein n=1 Tax=Streptomyces olivaceoviridis TaxID=1921 RepID=UPI0033B886E3
MWNQRADEDWATTDPAYYDPEFPPEHFPMHFLSEGTAVQGFMWLAQGESTKGCVIFVPQFYGGDSLEGLITPLVSAGIHVLKFHPRGMWDDNEYTFPGVIDDINAAVEHLRENDGVHVTEEGRRYVIDPARIAVIGKSGGGGVTGWAATAENSHLSAAIAVAPVNPEITRGLLAHMNSGDTPSGEVKELAEASDRTKAATAGRVDTFATLQKLTPQGLDRMDLIRRASELVDKKLLLIGGSADRHAPLASHHRPIAAALKQAGAKHLTEVILEGDTFFLTARIALARLVLDWLRNECGF